MNFDNEILERKFQEIEKELERYPIKLSDFLKEEFQDTEWVIKRLIPVDGLVALSGVPGSYKTWVALSIAECVAQGEPLFGHFETTPRSVLIIDEENSRRLVHKRLLKLGLNPYLPVYLSIQRGLKVDRNEDLEFILKVVDEFKIGLVIFDSLIRIHNKDENDAKEMSKVFENLKKITNKGVAVLFTHHHRKQPSFAKIALSQSLRGSSDILAAVDCHLAIEQAEEHLIITQTKLREDEAVKPFKVGIKEIDGKLTIEYLGEHDEVKKKRKEAKEAILELLKANKEMLRKEIIEALGKEMQIGVRTLGEALKELEKAGQIILKDKKGKGGAYIYQLPEEEGEVVQ